MAAYPELWPWGLGLVGLLVGSFVALLTVRLPTAEPVALTRSRCRSCSRLLGPLELVPVLSWAALRGRCRGCGVRISPRYPAIELACAGLGVWSGLAMPGLAGAASALLAWQLLLIAVIDAEHYWLPDRLTWPLGLTGLAAAALLQPESLPDRAIGAVAGFAALWLIGAAYKALRGRQGLGGGDPWLLAGLGAWVGWAALPTVLVWACVAGLAAALAARVRGRAVSLSDRLPFGVFLAMGGWFAWLYGPIGAAGL